MHVMGLNQPRSNQPRSNRPRSFRPGLTSGPWVVTCAGAILWSTAEEPAKCYAMELDAQRSRQAGPLSEGVIHGSAFDMRAPVESLGLIYLNQPS